MQPRPADPKIIHSPLSGHFTRGGMTVDVQIYRLEDTDWSLEVVDAHGGSTVWNDLFPSDTEANAEFMRTINEEGMATFLSQGKGLPG